MALPDKAYEETALAIYGKVWATPGTIGHAIGWEGLRSTYIEAARLAEAALAARASHPSAGEPR